jgi:hypothetical protein
MPSRWIEFVKDWASKNGISYGCALSNSTMVAEYHKKYNTPKHQERERSRDMEQMDKEDVRSKAVRTTEQEREKISQLKAIERRKEEHRNEAKRNYEEVRQRVFKDMEDQERQKKKEPKKVEPKKVEPKNGKVEIHILDRQRLNKLFEKNYDAGDDAFYGFPKAPNGNYYDENDWDTLTEHGRVMSNKAFEDYKPLADKLQKMGLLDYDIHYEEEEKLRMAPATKKSPAQATKKPPPVREWVFKPKKDNYGSTEVEERYLLPYLPNDRKIPREGLYKNDHAEDFTVGDFKEAINKIKKPETSVLLRIAKRLAKDEFGKIIYYKK